MSRALSFLLLGVLTTACGAEPATDQPYYGEPEVLATPGTPRGELPTTPPPVAPAGSTPKSPLERLQLGAIGRWKGTGAFVTEPSRQWTMWLELRSDGHYSAGCLDELCLAAFQEGNDDEHPSKQYAIYDLASGSTTAGIGELWVLFGGDGKVGATAWRGQMTNVQLSTDGEELSFDYARLWFSASDDLRYTLRRVH